MSASRTVELVSRLTTLDIHDWSEPMEVGPTEVAEVLASATHEGLVCLLGAAIDRSLVLVDDRSAEMVLHAWTELMARSVQLDLLLLEVSERLAAAGVASRVLKGVAVASLDERDAAWRSYNDVDVLVPSGCLLAAADALAPLGLHPATPPLRRGWAGRYAKGLTLLHESGAQVDLHRLLATGPLGTRVRSECLFERGRPLRVGTVTLTALADEHRFLHACYHAALGGIRGARHRRDILLLASTVAPDVVMAQIVDGWSPAVVRSAVRWAGADEGLPAAWAQWLADVECDPADDELLTHRPATFGERSLVELRSLHGPVERLRFAAGLAWPSRSHLRSRDLGRLQYLRRLGRLRPSSGSAGSS
ncbi:MAG: nucleotidyltransferase family protein [Actinomycetota bacterium]|nr:nucleotidyltransferase family protein [Actinomycetota bacterium]